ncbi:hypothetical protein [Owenweeksia hongkongensis]|uniref:hypothetical protein n=1 Tax=Owenweeksia hongkongensis TaxID=253245 RepID=UPI003A91EC1E
MNSRELDKRIEELMAERNSRHQSLLTTSDKTRDFAGSIQNGMYWGQMAIGVFRKLTNYHYPPKKRIKQVLITVSVLIVANLIRKTLVSRTKK